MKENPDAGDGALARGIALVRKSKFVNLHGGKLG